MFAQINFQILTKMSISNCFVTQFEKNTKVSDYSFCMAFDFKHNMYRKCML